MVLLSYIHFTRVEMKWFLSCNFSMFPFLATCVLVVFFFATTFHAIVANCRIIPYRKSKSHTGYVTHNRVRLWVNAQVSKCNPTIIYKKNFWMVCLLRIMLCFRQEVLFMRVIPSSVNLEQKFIDLKHFFFKQLNNFQVNPHIIPFLIIQSYFLLFFFSS